MSTLMVSMWEKIQRIFNASIFNQRPPQSRYVFIWGVGIVLQYIKTQWYDNPSLTNADLTCKFATLLALTTALKAFLIQHLNTEFMAKYKDKNIFFLASLKKVGVKINLTLLLPFLLLVKISHCV